MIEGPLALGRRVAARARERQVPFLAAGVAYYAFVSVIPALLVVLALAATLAGDRLADAAIHEIGGHLTPTGRAAIEGALVGARGRTGATVIGVLVLAWSGLRVFRGLDLAFAQVYGLAHDGGLVHGVRDAAVVAGTIGLGTAGMVSVGAVLPRLPVGADVAGLAGLLVGLTVVFLPLYVVFPGEEVGVREAVPGAALAAVGWVALQAAFQVYAAAAPGYDLYGVIGGVLLLVTWFYFAAVVILLGATVNAVLGEEANRQVQHGSTRDG